MNVTYRTDFDPKFRKLAERALPVLETELGASADRVTAEWGVAHDENDRPLIELKLTDWTGSVSAKLAPDDFDKPAYMDWRIARLWGDLLQVRSHKQLERLLHAVDGPIDN